MKSLPRTLLTTDEAAKLLRFSPATLARRRVYGLPPRFVRAGGRVYYTRQDLAEFLQRDGDAPTEAA